MTLRKRLQRWMPTPESVRSNRSLAVLGPLLERPWLWNLSRRRVAAGAAIGVFFAFILPIAQILLAAGAAVLLRANLPVAALATLITNPFTFAPLYVAAYYTGAALLGETASAEVAASLASDFDPSSLLDRTTGVLKPWFTGLAVFATGGAVIAWVLVNVAWIAGVRWRRWRGTRRMAAR